MKPLTPKEVEKYLASAGYMLSRIRGSHHTWIHPVTGRAVVVAHHGSRTIPQGTLLAIFRAAAIPPPRR